MTAFHEQIRLVLTDVEKFCEGLNGVKLSKKLSQDKEKITKGLNNLFEEYPNLKPQAENKTKSKSKDERDVSDGSVKTVESLHNEEDESTETYPDMAIKDLENPDKCGYLEKKKKKELVPLFKQSQKRYCVIHNNVFYYYEKPTDKKQCGAFSLVGYEFKAAPDKIKEASKKDLCFELSAPNKRCYEFIADSQEDYDSWKEAICNAANASQDEIIETEDIYEAIGEEAAEAPPLAPRKVPSLPPPQPPSDIEEYEAAEENKAPSPVTEEIYADAESADTAAAADEAPAVPPSRSPGGPSKPNISLPEVPPPRSTPSRPTIAPPAIPPARKSPIAERRPSIPPPPTPSPTPPPPPSTPLPPTPTPPPPSMPLPAVPTKKKIICPAEDYENMFYGKWDCSGGADDELSFKRGDIIHVINFDFDKDNWWVGELMGKYGLVPKEYLTRAYEEVTAA